MKVWDLQMQVTSVVEQPEEAIAAVAPTSWLLLVLGLKWDRVVYVLRTQASLRGFGLGLGMPLK